jgi:hypothetical protein
MNTAGSDAIQPRSVDSTTADTLIGGLMGIYETAFPGRIRSCYVEGSYADGTELTTSDIDLTLVFKDRFTSAAEHEHAARLAEHCAAVSSVEIDIQLADDAELAKGVYPAIKFASRCVYGEDRRADLFVLPIEEWSRQRMHAAYWLLVMVFNRKPVVAPPLDYPDPAADFFGYTQRTVRVPTGTAVASTRNLIRVTGWIATALLAWRTRVYVARKSDCHHLYRHHIGDEWAPFLEDLYSRCRRAWGYLIPTDAAERHELRDLCVRALQFENHFLRLYRDYVLTQLGTDDEEAPLRALQFLEEIPYCDEHVRLAIQTIADGDDTGLQEAARRAYAAFEYC